MMRTFLDRIEAACRSRHSLLCVGLDPDPERMPPVPSAAGGVKDVFEFNRAIIDATADLVCAYKPNMAFYEALGIEGLTALKHTIRYIREVAKGVLVIGDVKRGDVSPSMKSYYKAMFDVWGFDAFTVSPYVGIDSVEAVRERTDKAVFVLCHTSNEGARDFQDIKAPINGEERPIYQHVALRCLEWNVAGNIGLVVGANYPEELKTVRELCPDMPFLIPGVGAQGGSLEEAVRWGTDSAGRMALINSSRQVLYASGGKDFAEAARKEASRLRDEINAVLTAEGKGWS